ncbi:hypothetical protein NIIDMKKI_27020 [Mycobacterium kansasii]|uniref:Major facilitator superfamily (MFS) profile domain-containing protein n=1 Tax=Mycobacterium kansasii TaxID=1768 RepID=A0A7G1I965_MYCKA|nr:hypothetical protein NIIDMKKI_27020 [Mycobacterium kansasii]
MRNDPRGVVLACCGALVVVMSAVAGVNVALPDIALDQGASATDLTWIADAYTVALAALVLPAGAIGDDFGRRRTSSAAPCCSDWPTCWRPPPAHRTRSSSPG